MVAILDEDNSVDLQKLWRDSQRALPAYARPVFVRKTRSMDYTGTGTSFPLNSPYPTQTDVLVGFPDM